MSDPHASKPEMDTPIGTERPDGDADNVIALDPPRAPLSPEARRALEEADARRKERDEAELARAREIGGREGPDPVRYGDWETGGICTDF